MAHFSQIDENNIVTRVLVVSNDEENRGQEFLANDLNFGGTWIKTSYNSRGGKRYDPITNEYIGDNHFRYNFGIPGFYYDEQRDAFIPPKPYPSWILNENSCLWEPPISMPETDGPWTWNEKIKNWEKINIVNL